MFEQVLPYFLFVLGVAGRVFVPYAVRFLEDESRFDWRYVVAQIVTAFVALLPMVAADVASFLANVGALGVLAAVVYGWFSADLGREIQKGVGAAATWER